jgi:hypothetical protein
MWFFWGVGRHFVLNWFFLSATLGGLLVFVLAFGGG